MTAAFDTGIYRNLLEEYGYKKEEVERRLEGAFHTIFYGSLEDRFYHEAGEDMAYVEDTGNHDVRTEGMSYAMMVCVQLNKKPEFDRLWKWVCRYMKMEEGPGYNYFAWSCGTDGKRNADGPAPDGEEFSPWLCSLPPTAGGTAKGFSITAGKPKTFSGNVSIKVRRDGRENLCGTGIIS